MKTIIKEASKKIEEAKELLRKEEEKVENEISLLTGISAKNIRIIRDDFISIDANNMDELKSAIKNIKADKRKFIIKHSKEIELDFNYRLDIKNNVRSNEFKVEFYSDGVMFWVSIPMQKLEDNFREEFFTISSRKVYEIEFHYFTGVSRNDINQMRLREYDFSMQQIGWYGGDKTLVDEPIIKEMIDELKK